MTNETNTLTGTYGGSQTPCTIYTMNNDWLSTWYVVEGSTNINCTIETLTDGVDVETVDDYDTMTSDKPINSEDDLRNVFTDEDDTWTIREKLDLAHQLKAMTDCSDPVTLRNAVEEWGDNGPWPDDITLQLEGSTEWRCIEADKVEQAVVDWLEADTYVMGGMPVSDIASAMGWDTTFVEMIQNAEGYEELGNQIVKLGKVNALARELTRYNSATDYLGTYDGTSHEMTFGDVLYVCFRVN